MNRGRGRGRGRSRSRGRAVQPDTPNINTRPGPRPTEQQRIEIGPQGVQGTPRTTVRQNEGTNTTSPVATQRSTETHDRNQTQANRIQSHDIPTHQQQQAAQGMTQQQQVVTIDGMQDLSLNDERKPDNREIQTFETGPRMFNDASRRTTGTKGQEVDIITNYFKLSTRPNSQLYQYHCTFEPDIGSLRLKKALLYQLEDVLGKLRIFDGMQLFVPKELESKEIVRTAQDRNGTCYSITFIFTSIVPKNSPTMLQIINTLFKAQLRKLGMIQFGRSYFSEKHAIDVPAHKMQIWPGVSTSISQYEENTMLCADVIFKVLSQQSVLELLIEINKTTSPAQFQIAAKKKLIGAIVHTGYNNKTYRIHDINFEKNMTHEFQKGDGTSISFQAYYEQAYQRKTTQPNQPLLVVLPKDKDRKRGQTGEILLVPEFCVVTGIPDEIRSNYSVMKDLDRHTKKNPTERAVYLKKFVAELHENDGAAEELRQWNMKFNKDLLHIKGRVLDAPDILQNNAKFMPYNGSWDKDMRNKQLISPVSMRNWLLVYSQRDANVAVNFVNMLQKVCGPMGMNVAQPDMKQLRNDSVREYFQCIKECLTEKTEIVVCIVPNNRKDRYDAIKKLCCVERPVPSQVVIGRTIGKKETVMSVCTKIGIQINCKLGGEVWAVNMPPINLMVIGFDVYHDSMTKGKSVGGFIASLNSNLTQYYSRITMQRSHQEICDQLSVCMAASLKKFHEVRGTLPDNIIVYRDGVGDGQLNVVYDYEIPQYQSAIKEIYPADKQPGFTMIIVKKRISTRLLLSNNGQVVNPRPGTVVDSVVTRPEWFDFYLVSQSVRQGTVTPTSYNVIYDTNKQSPDMYQKITYKLCHLYYNWPGTIRVPAPCQYAHKLAFLVGQSIHQEPDLQLADRLYYL